MQIFEKFSQISEFRPIAKFYPDPRKTDPPNIWRTPSTEKSGMYYCEVNSLNVISQNQKLWKNFDKFDHNFVIFITI